MKPIIYIYRKGKKVLVLGHDEALKEHSKYVSKGYEHLYTIDTSAYIASLLKKRSKEALWNEIQSLKK